MTTRYVSFEGEDLNKAVAELHEEVEDPQQMLEKGIIECEEMEFLIGSRENNYAARGEDGDENWFRASYDEGSKTLAVNTEGEDAAEILHRLHPSSVSPYLWIKDFQDGLEPNY